MCWPTAQMVRCTWLARRFLEYTKGIFLFVRSKIWQQLKMMWNLPLIVLTVQRLNPINGRQMVSLLQ